LKDRLAELVEKQDELHSYVGFCSKDKRDSWTDEERQMWLGRMLLAANGEVTEVLEETGMVKWWKRNPSFSEGLRSDPDWASIKTELTDVLFFVLGSMICAGMSADDIYEEYLKKHKTNLSRSDWDRAKETKDGKEES
jgi:NTP pyrophosphatase (non-canonical NTP hydrolase)